MTERPSKYVVHQLLHVDEVYFPREVALVVNEFVFRHYFHLGPKHLDGSGVFVVDTLRLPTAGRGVEVAGLRRGVAEFYPLSTVVELEKGQVPFITRMTFRTPCDKRSDLFEQASGLIGGYVEIDVDQRAARPCALAARPPTAW